MNGDFWVFAHEAETSPKVCIHPPAPAIYQSANGQVRSHLLAGVIKGGMPAFDGSCRWQKRLGRTGMSRGKPFGAVSYTRKLNRFGHRREWLIQAVPERYCAFEFRSDTPGTER